MEQTDLTMRSLKLRYARDMAIWFIVLLMSVAWWWFAVTPSPVAAPLMEFSDARTVTTTPLCPGDTLPYSIVLHVSEPGVYAVDVSVWRMTPPATVIFSEARRFVISRATDYTLPREWSIPLTHPDPTTNGQVTWQPGRYERRHAISTVSRAAKPSIVVIPFTIAERCP
jgi:hypothetical protein